MLLCCKKLCIHHTTTDLSYCICMAAYSEMYQYHYQTSNNDNESSETHSRTGLGLVLRSHGQSKAAFAVIRRAGSSSSILSSKSNAGPGNLHHITVLALSQYCLVSTSSMSQWQRWHKIYKSPHFQLCMTLMHQIYYRLFIYTLKMQATDTAYGLSKLH